MSGRKLSTLFTGPLRRGRNRQGQTLRSDAGVDASPSLALLRRRPDNRLSGTMEVCDVAARG